VEQATRRAWGNPASAQSSSHASTASRRSLRAEHIQALLAEARPRVLVFRNGDGRQGVQVVQGEQARFVEDCATRLKLPAKVKLLFDMGGHELTAVPSTLCDQSLFWLLGRIVGPVWASTGAPFSLDGPHAFLRELKVRLQARRRAVRERLAKAADGEGGSSDAGAGLEATRRLDHLLDIDKMAWYQLRAHNDQLTATLAYLEGAQERLAALEEDSESRIPAIAAESHVLARPALRLRALVNGTPLYRPDGATNARMVSFDLAAASRGIPSGGAAALVFERLLDSLTQALGLPSKARRLFSDSGVEVTTLSPLKRDATVYVSMGEPFVSQIRIVLEAPLPSSDGPASAPQSLTLSCAAVAESTTTTPFTKWVISRVSDVDAAGASGVAVISCAGHPNLVLTAKDGEVVLQAFATPASADQQWVLSSVGTIAPRSNPTLLLAMVPPETAGELREGVHLALRLQAAAGRGGAPLRTQLWGIRQDSFALIGQWRLPGNPRALAKEALLWPVQAAGDWNPRVSWPVDGMLVAGVNWDDAAAEAAPATAVNQPALRVLANGVFSAAAAAAAVVVVVVVVVVVCVFVCECVETACS
jgi:hypothetical protein